jgi:hypothetical protein
MPTLNVSLRRFVYGLAFGLARSAESSKRRTLAHKEKIVLNGEKYLQKLSNSPRPG